MDEPAEAVGAVVHRTRSSALAHAATSPYAAIEAVENVHTLYRCLAEMPVRHSMALCLRYGLHGEPHSYREVGQSLGVSGQRAAEICLQAERIAARKMGAPRPHVATPQIPVTRATPTAHPSCCQGTGLLIRVRRFDDGRREMRLERCAAHEINCQRIRAVYSIEVTERAEAYMDAHGDTQGPYDEGAEAALTIAFGARGWVRP